MSFEKIFVLGAGAIGSPYGGFLSRKNDVTLIGEEAHKEAISPRGLVISGDHKESFSMKAKTEIKKIPKNSLILLTTKAQDSATAIKGIKDMLRRDTVIVILQNGLGNKEIVKGIVGEEINVVRGLVEAAAEFLEAGKIVFWQGETILEHTEIGERIVSLFNENGLKARVSNEMERDIWHKLIVNCVVNPLTAILQVRNNEIVADSLRQLRHGIIKECIEVGKCEGLSFQPNLGEAIDRKISRYTNFSSMCQDIMKGKKTEIDFLNGKVVELGKKHHVPTPINKVMVGIIKFLEVNR
jgi:2-dehydropantoate 2-reductase